MDYILCNNENFLAIDKNNRAYIVHDIADARRWTQVKANNVLKTINKEYKKYHLSIKAVPKENREIVPFELDYQIIDKVRDLKKFYEEIKQRKAYLGKQLQLFDLEISDIRHAAEFYNLNVVQGYKLYKRLHDVSTERRKCKDELMEIGLALGTQVNYKNINNLEKSIQGLSKRKYTPRVNKELFER